MVGKKKKLQEQLTEAKHEIQLKEKTAQNNSGSAIDESEHLKLKERYNSSKSEITTLQEHVNYYQNICKSRKIYYAQKNRKWVNVNIIGQAAKLN